MGAVWFGLAVAVVAAAGVAAVVLRRRSAARRVDAGAISDGWLAEQRGRQES